MPFVLRVVAGACVGRGSGQPRMPPRERQHEEVFVWGILLRLDWEPLREHVLTTGVVRHACRHRVTARGVFGFVGGGALLPFVLRACCEGMCWPRERPATHAAAGAAARGGFCFGEFFCGWTEGGCGGEGLTTGVVRHACRHRVTARGVFGFVGGGVVAVCFEGLLRGHVLAGGPASHACRRGSGSTRRFLFWGILLRLD